MAGFVWWASFWLSHTPYLIILLFLGIGLIERLGYIFIAREEEGHGKMPRKFPRVCIQLPMYEEVVSSKQPSGLMCG
jgi:hypothetical protein